jgi:hypothetical protein
MAGPVPDLVIPVRMDLDKALKGLTRLGEQGQETARKNKEGFQEAQSGVEGFHDRVSALLATQMSLAVLQRVGAAIGSEFKRAADYVRDLAKDFADLRQTMQQVAALKGQPNTNLFTIEEVKKGAAANLTPDEWRRFQENFQSYAGAQIEGPQAKLTAGQAEEYQQRVAAFMKARGVPSEQGAELAGALLEYATGPQDVEKLMGRFGAVYQTLEKARTPVPELLPQLARVMSHGVSAEQAAQMLATVAPAAPHEEGVAVEAAMRSILEMKQKGIEDFGVKKGMTPMEAIKAFSMNINERRKALIAQGKTDQEAEDVLLGQLAEKKVAVDVREARGLVQGFGYQGIQLGGLERFRRYTEETPADFTARAVKEYEQTDAGKAAKRAADLAVARAERRAQYQGVVAEREAAKAELTRGGEGEAAGLECIIRGMTGFLTGQTAQEQIGSEQALFRVRQRAKAVGVTEREAETRDASLDRFTRDVPFRSMESVNNEILALLRLIEAHTGGTHEETKKANDEAPMPPGAARGTVGPGARPVPAALPGPAAFMWAGRVGG